MKALQNVGGMDRIGRFVLGVILLLVAFLADQGSAATWIVGILGVVMLATSAIKFCPLYLPFKLNTNKNG